VVSGQLRIADHDRFYAAEFSPNGQVLYATLFRCDPLETNDLIQFDISVQDSASISSSRLVLHAAPYQTNCDGAMGVIAQGPDRRLYVALNTVPYISVIDQPDIVGSGCMYQHSAVSLGGRNSYLALPNQVKFEDSTPSGILTPVDPGEILHVWPSPTTGKLTAQWHALANSSFVQAACFNALGACVWKQERRGEQAMEFDIGALSPGAYTLALTIDEGRSVLHAGFIVE
ncbi:MAG: hypothetical protein KA230_03995, partial [Flavobacteriales bacterium]|nr:hypothetical protein [Flavobacteriales bacterium]